VLDFTTGDGSDAASLALTHAQRLASDAVVRAWAAVAAGSITRERITVVGYGPIPLTGTAADAALLASDAAGSFAPLWASDGSAWHALGTRVLLEIVPPTSRAVISATASRVGAALGREASAAAAAAALSGAAGGSAAYSGPGRWLSGEGVAGWSRTMPASLGASGDTGLVPITPAEAGLSLEWIIGLSVAGAVLVGLCLGLCVGRIVFSGWWCCLQSGGRAITMADRRKLERAERGERSVVLAGKRDRRGSMQALARVHPDAADSEDRKKSKRKKMKKRLQNAARRASAVTELAQKPKRKKGVAFAEQRPKLDTSGDAQAASEMPSPLKANATGKASPHRRKK
jgi:hypothetical protein